MNESSEATRTSLGVAFAMMLLVGLLFLANALGGDAPVIPEAVPAIDDVGPPLAGAERVTLGEAISQVPVPLYRPSGSLASDEMIDGIWFRGGDHPKVYIRYESGVIVTVRPAKGWPTTTDYARVSMAEGIDGSVEEVGGIEAFVVSPHYPSLGSVRFFLGDALIVVIGRGPQFTTSQLHDVALSTIQRGATAESEHAAKAT